MARTRQGSKKGSKDAPPAQPTEDLSATKSFEFNTAKAAYSIVIPAYLSNFALESAMELNQRLATGD